MARASTAGLTRLCRVSCPFVGLDKSFSCWSSSPSRGCLPPFFFLSSLEFMLAHPFWIR
jgi:hypothetical protein